MCFLFALRKQAPPCKLGLHVDRPTAARRPIQLIKLARALRHDYGPLHLISLEILF